MNNEQRASSKRSKPHYQLPITIFLILLATFLRLYRLPELPPGLNFDEAGSGVLALDILSGSPRLWWRIGGGQEPLWPYLAALSITVLGNTPLALRLPAALIGILTIAAVYPLIVRFFRGRQPHLTALLTLAGLTLSGWHLHFSRLGFRAILLPLLATLGFYFLWRSLSEPRRRLWLIFTSFFIALAIYTYLAARLLPIVIVCFLLLAWMGKSIRRSVFLRLISHFSFLISLFLLPLILYFILNPADFTARAATVSIFNPAWNKGDLARTIWQTLTLTLGTFLGLGGDINSLVNLRGQPAVSVFLAPFFILGLGAGVYRIFWENSSTDGEPQGHDGSLENRPHPRPLSPRRGEVSLMGDDLLENRSSWGVSADLFLLCWWGAMLLPAILAPEGAPHHLRLIGMMVPTYAFVAIGLVTATNFLIALIKNGLRLNSDAPARLFGALPVICYLLVAFQTYNHYFIRWPISDDFTLPFDLYAIRLADNIARTPPEAVYILPMDIRAAEEARHYTLDYLLASARSSAEATTLSSYIYIPVDEHNAETLLSRAAVGKNELRLVRWTEDKHHQADAKEIVTFLLETGARLVRRETFPVYEIETYVLSQPESINCNPSQNKGGADCLPPALRFKLPSINQPIAANFDGLLRLDSAYVQPTAHPGEWLPVALTFAPLAPLETDYKASVRLVSPDGTRIAQKDRVLLHNFHQGTSLWPSESVNEYYLLPIPPETPPGGYTASVVIYHPETLAPLITNGLAELPLNPVQIVSK